MKKKIKIRFKGKTEEREVALRDFDHFQAQLKFRHLVRKPKKGKGSFKRKKGPDEES